MEKLNILVFGYLRPQKLYDCLNSLKNNKLSQHSSLTICVDGLRNEASENDKLRQKQLLDIAHSQQWCNENKVIVNDSNYGIKLQYFSKIEYMLQKADHVIVLEEDTIVGLHFLDYMKGAFERYGDNDNIIMIGASVYEIKTIAKNNSCFFARGSGNKAFGFTRTYWQKVDQDCVGWEKLKTEKELRESYNTPGVDSAALLIDELENKRNNSWDSIIHWSSFVKKLLILCPDRTLAIDNGWGEGATNCVGINLFENDAFDIDYKIENYPLEIKENVNNRKKIRYYFKYTLRLRFWKQVIKDRLKLTLSGTSV